MTVTKECPKCEAAMCIEGVLTARARGDYENDRFEDAYVCSNDECGYIE